MPRISYAHNPGLKPYSEHRREYLEQKRQRAEENRIANHVNYVVEALQHIHGPSVSIEPFLLRMIIVGGLACVHKKLSNRFEAAAHESGHFFAYEYEGVRPYSASITGSAFGYQGWSGEAKYLSEELIYDPSQPTGSGTLPPPDPEYYNRLCRITLAGPLAEELIAKGSALSNFGELVSARVYSNYAADLLNLPRTEVFEDNIRKSAAMIEQHYDVIGELATILRNRKEILRSSARVRNLMERARIKAPPIISKQAETLAAQVIRETSFSPDFVIEENGQ